MIELKNISLKFEDKIVFDNYSQTFKDNTINSILGQSGCGKSTMLRIISGLIQPQNGCVEYNGKKIVNPIPEIFMMHQSYTNFPWKTCIENVLIPIKIKNEKITNSDIKNAKHMLNCVGLMNCENKFPYQLSGGMKQRLSLARVLISKPPVILMDEPLSALDPETRCNMQDLIMKMHLETSNTIIMVTHDVNEAKKMSDYIINL